VPRQRGADAGHRQDQSGVVGEGLLRCPRPRYSRVDDEAGATKSPLYHLARRSAGGEVSNLISIFIIASMLRVAIAGWLPCCLHLKPFGKDYEQNCVEFDCVADARGVTVGTQMFGGNGTPVIYNSFST
jgi:hypothetical protein